MYPFKHWDAWCVVSPKKGLLSHTIAKKRSESIDLFEEDDIGSWKRWYRRGFRCRKIRIVEP